MTSIRKKTISNTSYLMMDTAVVTVFGYIFWLVLAKTLSPSDLGMFSSILNSALIISTIIAAGISIAVAKILSIQLSKKQSQAENIIGWSFKWVFILNLIVSMILYIGSSFFFESQISIILVISYLMVHSFFVLTHHHLLGFQKMKKIFLTNLVAYTLKILAAFTLVTLGFSYFGPVYAFIFSSLFVIAIRFYWVSISFGKIKKNIIQNIKKHAIASSISSGSWILLTSFGVIVLTALTDMNSVGVFTLALMFSTVVRMVPQTISASILPTISEQWGLGKENIVKKLSNNIFRYLYMFTIPFILFLIFFANEFILILSTTEYVGSVLPLQLLVVSGVFIGGLQMIMIILYSIGKLREYMNMNIAIGVSIVILSILLTNSYGVFGTAVAQLITVLLMFSYGIFKIRQILAIREFLIGFFKMFVLSIISMIPVVFLGTFISGWLYLNVSFVVYMILIFILMVLFRMFNEYDIFILDHLKNKIPKQLRFIISIVRSVILFRAQ